MGDSNLGPSMVPIVIVALVITTLAVALRCYVRIFMRKIFRIDDYLMLFAQACYYGFIISVMMERRYGMGKHVIDILEHDPKDLVLAMKYWWISQHFFDFATFTVKICVALFFLSLEPPLPLRIITYIVVVVITISLICIEAFFIFECHPVSFWWERLEFGSSGSCLDVKKDYAIFQTLNTMDIVTDVLLAVLPGIMVWRMNMRRQQKLVVAGLLGLGALPAIAAIIRGPDFRHLLDNAEDITYVAFAATVTQVVETGVGITVICVAQLRPLMRAISPKGWFSNPEPTARLEAYDIASGHSPSHVTGNKSTVHDTSVLYHEEIVQKDV